MSGVTVAIVEEAAWPDGAARSRHTLRIVLTPDGRPPPSPTGMQSPQPS